MKIGGGFEVLFSLFDSLLTVESIGSSTVAGAIGEKLFADIKILLYGPFLATGDALFGDLSCLDKGGTVCQPDSLLERSEWELTPVWSFNSWLLIINGGIRVLCRFIVINY